MSAEMSDWTIEPLEDRSDIESIIALDGESFSMPWPREMFLRAFDDPTDLRIALSRGANRHSCAGFVCYLLTEGRVEIGSIAVVPEARRRGLGSALIAYTLDEAKTFGATIVSLHVRISNKTARRFYERCGFTQSRVRHDYYQEPHEDALIYALRLGQPHDK